MPIWSEEQLQQYQKRRGKGLPEKPKRNKYNNKKTTVDGKIFDSKHEAERYQELLLLEKAGEITALQTQVKFSLIDKNAVNRGTSYIADFTYYDLRACEFVVEDAKGVRTEVYKVKKKLMFEKYGIEIREV